MAMTTGTTRRPSARPRLGKKGMIALGGTAGLLTVVTAMALHKSSSPPPGALATTDALSAATAQPIAETPALAGGALQANVPLFGATTLSTTEPVAAAAPGMTALYPELR